MSPRDDCPCRNRFYVASTEEQAGYNTQLLMSHRVISVFLLPALPTHIPVSSGRAHCVRSHSVDFTPSKDWSAIICLVFQLQTNAVRIIARFYYFTISQSSSGSWCCNVDFQQLGSQTPAQLSRDDHSLQYHFSP
jgi:hypothetical protein